MLDLVSVGFVLPGLVFVGLVLIGLVLVSLELIGLVLTLSSMTAHARNNIWLLIAFRQFY